jgi:drug/metabolite transporter (DMT)-like permease
MTDRTRHVRRGYVLAIAAASLWGLNGSMARFLLDDGMPATRMAEMRALVTFGVLLLALLAFDRRALRIRRQDVPRLAFLGIAGLALNNALYFVAIERLDIGVALVIQYLAPFWVLLWLRLAHGRRLPHGIWAAAGVSLLGCVLVVQAYDPGDLDGLGVLAALGSGLAYATYLFTSERAGHRYGASTTLLYGFLFSSIFWAVAAPLWSFPTHYLDGAGNFALGAYVAVLGTLVPFVCIVGAVRHVPASRVAVVATLEPVLAAAFAWPIHGQHLAAVQILGGAIVVGAVIWVQRQAPADEAEMAPAYSS